MKRSMWILGGAALAVTIASGGIALWVVASAQSSHLNSTPDPSMLVYTGEDLAGFLLDQDSARDATGSEIKLSQIGYKFNALSDTTFEPEVCAQLFGTPTLSPAGYRELSNHIPWTDEQLDYSLSEAVFQLPTISDGADAFADIRQAMADCDQFTQNFETGQGNIRSSTITVTPTALDLGGTEVVAGVLTSSGVNNNHTGVVSMRVNNVIISLQMVARDGTGIDEGVLRKLANAMNVRASIAEKIKIAGVASERQSSAPGDATPWIINFGSIGPVDDTMTAQTAIDALGLLGADVAGSREAWDPPNGSCAVYYLGNYRGVGLSSLSESDGAAGPLDSISNFADSGTKSIDANNLPVNRPQTAVGIRTGSTLAELEAAYPDQLMIERHRYIEGGHYVYLYGPDNKVITFNVNADDMVFGITTGRVPQAQYVEGCA